MKMVLLYNKVSTTSISIITLIARLALQQENACGTVPAKSSACGTVPTITRKLN